jgi:hypothetical protein
MRHGRRHRRHPRQASLIGPMTGSVQQALKKAGIEFINGNKPGVRVE